MSEIVGFASGNDERISFDHQTLQPGLKIRLTWESRPGPHSRAYTVREKFVDENGDRRIVLDAEGHSPPADFIISIYEELDRNGFDNVEIVGGYSTE